MAEYIDLAAKLGGTVVDMTENVINPLDLMTTASTAYPKGDVRDKVNRVLTLLGIYFSGLNDQQLSIISKALTKLYRKFQLSFRAEPVLQAKFQQSTFLVSH